MPYILPNIGTVLCCVCTGFKSQLRHFGLKSAIKSLAKLPLVLISSSIDTRKGANTDISSINVGGRDNFAIYNPYCFCTSASERFGNARGSACIASKLVISLRSISELHIFATNDAFSKI